MRMGSMIAIMLAAVAAAEPYDRIAVSIGNEVITESQLIQDLRVSAFLDRVPVDLSPESKRKSAERLVDQVLILRDAAESHLTLPTEKNVESLMEQIRGMYASDSEYEAALREYKITESEVRSQLVAGLVALTFTDLRFRPAVQVSDEDLREFYNKVQDGATFEAARDEIEEVITRQRTSDALDQWLANTRSAARVQYREQVFR